MRYKFRYYNSFYKLCAAFAGPFQNFFLVMVISLGVYYLIGRITVLLGIELLLNETVIGTVLNIFYLIAFLMALAYCVLKKGVFLYNSYLEICRYTVTPLNWKPKITISYNEIASVNVNYADLHFTKNRFRLLMPASDEAYNIELTLKNGKKYFFSIENQEQFCENLEYLIEQYTGVKTETAEDSPSNTADDSPYSEN